MKPGMRTSAPPIRIGQSPESVQRSPAKETRVATAARNDSESPSALATKLRTSSAMRWSGLSASAATSSIWHDACGCTHAATKWSVNQVRQRISRIWRT